MEIDFFAAFRVRPASAARPGGGGRNTETPGREAAESRRVQEESKTAGLFQTVETPAHGEHPSKGNAKQRDGPACPVCGGLDFWENAAGLVLCRSCVPPPTLQECLAELEELVRQHAGRLFRVIFESDCCWIAHGPDGRGWPDAYVAAVFKGCEALLDGDAARREALRRLQANVLGRSGGKERGKRPGVSARKAARASAQAHG